jgi:hypothetical protein
MLFSYVGDHESSFHKASGIIMLLCVNFVLLSKICGFHSGDYEERRLLGCGSV